MYHFYNYSVIPGRAPGPVYAQRSDLKVTFSAKRALPKVNFSLDSALPKVSFQRQGRAKGLIFRDRALPKV